MTAIARLHLLLLFEEVCLNVSLHIAVCIFDDLLNPQVCFLGVEVLVDNEPIDFVQHQASLDLGLPSLLYDRSGLRADTLDDIDDDKRAV